MVNSIKTFIAVLFVLLLASCVTGCRTLRAPVTFSDDWTPPKFVDAARSNDTTWSSIRHQEIDASKPLSIYELGEMALHNSPATRQSWETARAAEAKMKQAESAWYPQATLSSQFLKEKLDANNKANNENYLSSSPAATVKYLVFDFGGRSAKVKGALETLLAADYQFNQAIQDLLRDVGQAYYELYSAQASIVAAKADVNNAKRSLDAAEQKLKAGLVSKLDVLQAASNYYSVFYSLEDAKGKLKTAKARLANIIGFPADTKYSIIVPAKKRKIAVLKSDVSMLIDRALSQRPDIAAARANVRAKEDAVWAANSDLWPTVNYTGSATRDLYTYYNDETDFGDDYDYIMAKVVVSWDVFDGFNNLNKKREAEATLRRERETLRQAELDGAADVWIKYFDYKTATKKLNASKAYLKASSASYDLALESYDAGLKSMLDLIQAETDLSGARSRLIQSEKDMFIALVDLAHSLGELNAKDAGRAAQNMSKK